VESILVWQSVQSVRPFKQWAQGRTWINLPEVIVVGRVKLAIAVLMVLLKNLVRMAHSRAVLIQVSVLHVQVRQVIVCLISRKVLWMDFNATPIIQQISVPARV